MPRVYKKRMTKKSTYRKKRPTVRKVMRMVQKLKPEVKEKIYTYTDVNGGNFSSISYGSSAISCQLANGITQGVTDGQRIGNRVKVIGIKIYFAFQNASADLYNNLRFLLLRPKTDRLGTGGTLIQNIFSGTASGGTQWAAPVDTERYRVYMDKVYNLYNRPQDGSGTGTIQPTRFLKRFFKVQANIQWDDEANVMKDFLLVAISDSAGVPNPGVIAGHVKVYYTDA